MKQAIEIPCMKARNLKDMEKERQSKRQIILYEMRNTTHYGVELELKTAMGNPQLINNILINLPHTTHEVSSRTFMRRVEAIHKIYFIIVELRNLPARYVVLQHFIIPRLLLYIRSHQLCRGHTLIKAVKVLKLLIHDFPVQVRQQLVNHGGAATFVRLLRHSSQNKMKTLAMGAISSVRQFPLQFRTELLDHGAVPLIADLLRPIIELPMLDIDHEELLRRAVFCLPALCSRNPPAQFHQVEVIIPIVRTIILTMEPIGIYSSISASACWTLGNILHILKTDQQQQAQDIVDRELCRRFILLMQSANDSILMGTVHIAVYELVTTDRAFVKVLIDNRILRALKQNLNRAPGYQRLACNTIFALIYDNQAVVQQVLFDGKFMHPLLQILQDDNGENRTKDSAVIVLSEVARIGSDVHIEMMVNLRCIQFFCQYLNNADIRASCMQGLGNIIKNGNRRREIVQLVGHYGGDALRALRNDENFGELAQWILKYI